MPKGWCWTKLGEISDYGKCVTVPVSAIQDDEWVLELEDIEKDTGRILKQITKKERPINGSRHAFTKNQILYSKLRTYLNKVLIAPNNGYCTTEIIPISPQSGILPEYLNLVLRSPYFQEYTAQCGYGVKMPRLGTSDAIKSLIPVPPYGEQQRIIKSANKLADITERIQSEKEHLSEHITGCKSRILELAIYGKLVPQDPAEEPAIELLKRIKPDFTPSHNLHYEGGVPDGWIAVTYNDVAEYINGRAFNPEEWESNGLPIIRIQNLNEPSAPFNYSNNRFEKKYQVQKGDLLFAWAASLGVYIWKGQDAWLNQHIFKVIPYPFIEKEYLYHALSASINDFYQKSHGSGMVHITRKQFVNMPLLLPPIDEQKRIIKAIKAYYKVLDEIVADLNH